MSSEEINRFLFNEDTVDQVLATLMERSHKVCDGDRLGKTIIFARTSAMPVHRPALRYPVPRIRGHLRARDHPQHQLRPEPDRRLLPTREGPHIAISVDMLDTGIDVPEVVNLVFFKPVRSKTKFWQMIGRGTRYAPTSTARAKTRLTSTSSTSAATSNTSARTSPARKAPCRSP